eukprot:TRINITY_DN16684_c0_g1_i1.p2 TRINITY_DN16684_c0_g1~~TRINITY_DN16684_c0_g1_i1.p2  ORF type:complete len:346 (+),score=80.21 TRINITY_DN16684_c0_g1_i1:67-1038(+)
MVWPIRQGCADPPGWSPGAEGRTRRGSPPAACCREPPPAPPVRAPLRVALAAALFGGGDSYELCTIALCDAVRQLRRGPLPGLSLHLFIDRTVTPRCAAALRGAAADPESSGLALWRVESRLTGWGLSAMAYRNFALELLTPADADCVVTWDVDDRPDPDFLGPLCARSLRPGRGFFGNFVCEVPSRRRPADSSELSAALGEYYGANGCGDCGYGSDERALTQLAGRWLDPHRAVAEVTADARCVVWPPEENRPRSVEVGGIPAACVEFDERRAPDRSARLAERCPSPQGSAPDAGWGWVAAPGGVAPSAVTGCIERLSRLRV